MRLADWLNAVGLLAGPVVAVLITLIWTRLWQSRDRKVYLLRQLVATRALAHDPAFHVAINAIPIEFSGNSDVMEAWRNYIDAANKGEPPRDKLDSLVEAVMKALSYGSVAIGTVLRGAYVSKGFVNSQQKQTDALDSLVEIGKASTKSAAAAEEMVSRLPPRGPAAPGQS
jgi:hypothetical protein